MTDIETKARDALNAAAKDMGFSKGWTGIYTRKNSPAIEAMCREIEARERVEAELAAAKEAVVEACARADGEGYGRTFKGITEPLRPFLPKPADPLETEVRRVADKSGLALTDEQAKALTAFFRSQTVQEAG